MKKLFKKRHIATPLLLLFACLLVLLCLAMDSLELTFGLRTDLSFNAFTTTSATTQDILDEIHTPVHIYAVFPKGEEDLYLNEVLKRYQALNPLITYEITDITLNPTLVTRFKGEGDNTLTTYCLVVSCPETGRYKIIKYESLVSYNYSVTYETVVASGLNYEKALTEAVVYVTRDAIPKVAILQGHGELNADTSGYFTDFLTSNNYEVSFINLANGDSLDGHTLLYLISPQKDLTKAEFDTIMAFVNKGGSLFITCDTLDPVEKMPNYLTLLRLYGFVPLDGAVIASKDEPATYFDGLTYVLIPTMESTAPTSALIASSQDTVLFPFARAFETPTQTDNSLTVETVFSSSRNAYLCDVYREDIYQLDTDPTGPFALGLLAERMMDTTEISQAFIMSNSTMLTDDQQYAITDCGTFILRMTQQLLGQEGISLAIEQKAAVRPGLSATSQTLGLILIILAPLLVLAAALIVLVPRRNR